MSKCKNCGVCCSFYSAVDVLPDDPHFAFLSENQYLVPAPQDGGGLVMRQDHTNRCSALEGKVGERVQCSIYDKRPATCRDYTEDGGQCRSAVFVVITRKGKTLFDPDDPESWMASKDPASAPQK